jgi:hypothetical protein
MGKRDPRFLRAIGPSINPMASSARGSNCLNYTICRRIDQGKTRAGRLPSVPVLPLGTENFATIGELLDFFPV